MNRRPLIRKIGLGWLTGLTAALYLFLIRPWHLRWGASRDESVCKLPGDNLIPDPLMQSTRAITIQAPVSQVWSWVVQIGQSRGGFYSYDWLENLIGMDIHNVDQIKPELQNLIAGDEIPFWKGIGVSVIALEPNEILVLGGSFTQNEGGESGNGTGGTWVFVLTPVDDETTRLLIRTRVAKFPPILLSRVFNCLLLEPSHFIMERGMLLGIKRRAEQGRSTR
jgi:hypothetical protein